MLDCKRSLFDPRRLCLFFLGFAIGLFSPTLLWAQSSSQQIEGAPNNIVELQVSKGGHEGAFSIKNTGEKPLPLRLRLDTRDSDQRLPSGISVTFENKTQEASLAPGETRKVIVQWIPSQSKVREIYGSILLDGTSPPLHLGIHGELNLFPGNQILALLVLLPLLCGLFGLGAAHKEIFQKIQQWTAGIHLVLATWLIANLDRDFGRIDGNEGLQFIQYKNFGHLQLYLGADGASSLVAWTLAAALLLATWKLTGKTLAALTIGVTGLMLSIFSQDLLLLWCGLALGSLGLWLSTEQEHRGRAFPLLALFSLTTLGVCFYQLSQAVDAPLLLDGSTPIHSSSLPVILRSDHLIAGRTSLGLPLAAGAFLLLCAGTLPIAGAWPAGGWLRKAARRPGAALLIGPLIVVIFHTMLRLGSLAMPEGVTWGATTLAWGGAALALSSGIGALGEQKKEACLAWWSTTQIGLGLLGFGASTTAALSGAMICGVSVALAWLLAASREANSEVWSTWLTQFVAAGVPGTIGFWGPALVVFGAFPRQAPAAIVTMLGWLIAVVAALRVQQKEPTEEVQEGSLPPWFRLGLASVVIVLGFWPGALGGGLERWSLDLASFLNPPGPTWVAIRSSFPQGYSGGYGEHP